MDHWTEREPVVLEDIRINGTRILSIDFYATNLYAILLIGEKRFVKVDNLLSCRSLIEIKDRQIDIQQYIAYDVNGNEIQHELLSFYYYDDHDRARYYPIENGYIDNYKLDIQEFQTALCTIYPNKQTLNGLYGEIKKIETDTVTYWINCQDGMDGCHEPEEEEKPVQLPLPWPDTDKET